MQFYDTLFLKVLNACKSWVFWYSFFYGLVIFWIIISPLCLIWRLFSHNKICQTMQFHDTLYFARCSMQAKVEFLLLLHYSILVEMQKSKYTSRYLTLWDNNQKCRRKRILRSNFLYPMHFRESSGSEGLGSFVWIYLIQSVTWCLISYYFHELVIDYSIFPLQAKTKTKLNLVMRSATGF